jgi:hypothetical protein
VKCFRCSSWPCGCRDGIALIHGDCREVLPALQFDVVVTDPPYPRLDYGWEFIPPDSFGFTCRQFWFWMTKEPFPLTPTAIHVWAKSNVYIGDHEQCEFIYEVGGKRVDSVLRYGAINCRMNAQMNSDEFFDHPCQKPIRLIKRLVERTDGDVLDPFTGSGTTLVAAKQLNRKAIGIEIEERYCEIAANRLRQEVFSFTEQGSV